MMLPLPLYAHGMIVAGLRKKSYLKLEVIMVFSTVIQMKMTLGEE